MTQAWLSSLSVLKFPSNQHCLGLSSKVFAKWGLHFCLFLYLFCEFLSRFSCSLPPPPPLPKYNISNFYPGYATAHFQLLSLHYDLHICVTIWKAVRNLLSSNLQDLLSTILLARQA